MLAKRVIPCLDVDAGRVVKGINFVGLRDVGDPVEMAQIYEAQGADELVFLDISASHQGRETTLDVVRKTAEKLTIPLTVGGGIRSPDDMRATLNAGADKVAINTAALENPNLITECAERFGRQCVVVAVDAKRGPDGWTVFTHGGRKDTGLDAVAWCQTAVENGAGEILLTSMDADGTRVGYDLPLLKVIAGQLPVPVIASGGCGEASHMVAALAGGADAALAASIFHDGDATVGQVKQLLRDANVEVRL